MVLLFTTLLLIDHTFSGSSKGLGSNDNHGSGDARGRRNPHLAVSLILNPLCKVLPLFLTYLFV